ncbi:MAG TPA: Rrf2 family transcriptional regulator [Actinomycetota bacterium]|jgi:Rrf2 family protein|nr:Rrf2 family transcriptional regulator [Actinomycetota bacterium]
MNLTLSRRGDYVVRAAICLAGAWDGNGAYRKIREVADEMELPLSYTPQVLGTLARAGLAEAKAGREGGYRLTRSPEQISLLEVIEAAEGYLVSERCPLRGGPCRWDDTCAVHPTWIKASEAIRKVLSKTTLQEVSSVDRDLGSGAILDPAPKGHRVVDHAHAGGPRRSA